MLTCKIDFFCPKIDPRRLPSPENRLAPLECQTIRSIIRPHQQHTSDRLVFNPILRYL